MTCSVYNEICTKTMFISIHAILCISLMVNTVIWTQQNLPLTYMAQTPGAVHMWFIWTLAVKNASGLKPKQEDYICLLPSEISWTCINTGLWHNNQASQNLASWLFSFRWCFLKFLEGTSHKLVSWAFAHRSTSSQTCTTLQRKATTSKHRLQTKLVVYYTLELLNNTHQMNFVKIILPVLTIKTWAWLRNNRH